MRRSPGPLENPKEPKEYWVLGGRALTAIYRKNGTLAKIRKPGPKPAVSPEQAARIHELEKQLRRVSKRLRQAEAIIEIPKRLLR
ncbi:MAG: hypothetical protein JNJ88_01380 [Planctomycetes bacterium]|nr:hypothetical protein [Planctomycetota bacterium]